MKERDRTVALIDLAAAVVGVVGMYIIMDDQAGGWKTKALRWQWEQRWRPRLTWGLMRWGIISPAAALEKLMEEIEHG